jgi:hypothetical protein
MLTAQPSAAPQPAPAAPDAASVSLPLPCSSMYQKHSNIMSLKVPPAVSQSDLFMQ